MLASKATIAAEIGVIFIDDENQQVIGATDNSLVMQNAETLPYEKIEIV